MESNINFLKILFTYLERDGEGERIRGEKHQ